MINVVIPVYLGLAESQRCIESVLGARCETAHEIVVIDDASPDAALSEWLRNIERTGRIRLIVHPANQGFVASVNEGMAADGARDVVLLNSDTEVSDGWLDRLAACAARYPRVGTVTPFSSNATICSYPRVNRSNALPEGFGTRELDRLFAGINAGRDLDIPTAVGFCMLIRRECLDEIGAFDFEAFGRGYGEEVDFCMRARRAGYRNLLCADTFVFHEGEVSFRDSGTERRQAAQALVDERYPEFMPLVRDHILGDPARPLRRAIDAARLKASSRPRVLLAMHAPSGDAREPVDELVAPLASESEVLVLQPTEGGNLTVRWWRESEEFQAWFDPAAEAGALRRFLAELGVSRIVYRHVHGLPCNLLDLAASLGVPCVAAAVAPAGPPVADAGTTSWYAPVETPPAGDPIEDGSDMRRELTRLRRDLQRRDRETAELQRAHASHVAALENSAEAAREHVRIIQRSTLWRLMEPVRWTLHRAKLAAQSLRDSAKRVPPARPGDPS